MDETWQLERSMLGRTTMTSDGRTLTHVTARTVRRGGPVQLSGTSYLFETDGFGRRYRLSGPDGGVVATVQRTGPRRWDVESEAFRAELSGDGAPGRDLLLRQGDEVVGSLHRRGAGRRSWEARLQGIEPTVRLVLLLTVAARQSRTRRVVAVAR